MKLNGVQFLCTPSHTTLTTAQQSTFHPPLIPLKNVISPANAPLFHKPQKRRPEETQLTLLYTD